MENIVFEKNYERPQEDNSYCTAVFDQAMEGGFFQRYCDMMSKVPKIIVPQDILVQLAAHNSRLLVNMDDIRHDLALGPV